MIALKFTYTHTYTQPRGHVVV